MLIIISPVRHIQLSLTCRGTTGSTSLHINTKLSTSGASLETKLRIRKFQFSLMADQLLQFIYEWQWNQNNLPWLCTGPAFQSQAWWTKRMFFWVTLMSSTKPVTKLVQTQKKENITVCLLKIHFSVKYDKKYGKYDTFCCMFDSKQTR
jgi:hypothetical protein